MICMLKGSGLICDIMKEKGPWRAIAIWNRQNWTKQPHGLVQYKAISDVFNIRPSQMFSILESKIFAKGFLTLC